MWDPEQRATLTQMWGEGKSAGLIATALGKTRNAVVGQVYRLRLEPRKTDERTNTPTRSQRRNPFRRKSRLLPGEPLEVLQMFEVQAPLVSFLDLKVGMCRWPVDTDEGRMFCGNHARGTMSYCSPHCAAAFVPYRRKG